MNPLALRAVNPALCPFLNYRSVAEYSPMLELRVHAPNNAWIQAQGDSVAYYYVGPGGEDRARRDHVQATAAIAAGAPLQAAIAGLTGVAVDKERLEAAQH